MARVRTERATRFSSSAPKGKVLLALGKAGVAGDSEDTFNQPIGGGDCAERRYFRRRRTWRGQQRAHREILEGRQIHHDLGKEGSAPGEFDIPHALAFDSKGRLFVADRGNNRIQIFDQDGKFIDQWKQFSRPSGIFIDQE